jgi:hypothetical protein
MMPRVTSALAILLSMLTVAASTSTCDLMCWFNQGHSACHTVPSDGRQATDMSMPGMDMSSSQDAGPSGMKPMDTAGMDMGPQSGDAASLPARSLEANFHPMPGHLMPGQADATIERFEIAAPTGSATAVRLGDSDRVTPCAHAVCVQISVSSSPPRSGHAQFYFMRLTAIGAAGSTDLWTSVRRPTPVILHPQAPSLDPFATTLRI